MELPPAGLDWYRHLPSGGGPRARGGLHASRSNDPARCDRRKARRKAAALRGAAILAAKLLLLLRVALQRSCIALGAIFVCNRRRFMLTAMINVSYSPLTIANWPLQPV